MRRFLRWVGNEEGSAILEFVALALPLFIPLYIFLGNYAHSSDELSSLQILSRQMARAFVTSENDQIAHSVAYEVFVKGANVLGYGQAISKNELVYSIECSERPCISPDNEVRISISSSVTGIKISSVEYVSPWA